VQDAQRLAHGVYSVGTAGHGGVMVHESVAHQLSNEALRKGSDVDHWFQFEEDCRWAIPVYEHPEWGVVMFSWNKAERPETADPAYWLAETLKTISGWDADYLLARGIAPDPERYANYLKNKAEMEAWQKGNRARA
jgi:hypothetical protein